MKIRVETSRSVGDNADEQFVIAIFVDGRLVDSATIAPSRVVKTRNMLLDKYSGNPDVTECVANEIPFESKTN